MDLTYWYMFPIAIATLANSAGIGGATFFSPLMLIVLGLSPELAIGTTRATEVGAGSWAAGDCSGIHSSRGHDEQDASIECGEGITAEYEDRTVTSRDGEVFNYRLCRRRAGQVGAGVGGLLVGMISTGLGELNSYALVKRCRIPTRVTVAISVGVVAATALAARHRV